MFIVMELKHFQKLCKNLKQLMKLNMTVFFSHSLDCNYCTLSLLVKKKKAYTKKQSVHQNIASLKQF